MWMILRTPRHSRRRGDRPAYPPSLSTMPVWPLGSSTASAIPLRLPQPAERISESNSRGLIDWRRSTSLKTSPSRATSAGCPRPRGSAPGWTSRGGGRPVAAPLHARLRRAPPSRPSPARGGRSRVGTPSRSPAPTFPRARGKGRAAAPGGRQLPWTRCGGGSAVGGCGQLARRCRASTRTRPVRCTVPDREAGRPGRGAMPERPRPAGVNPIRCHEQSSREWGKNQ